jgi:hypothetical protein
LGCDTLQKLGTELEWQRTVAAKLSIILPQAVDRMTSKVSPQNSPFSVDGKKEESVVTVFVRAPLERQLKRVDLMEPLSAGDRAQNLL